MIIKITQEIDFSVDFENKISAIDNLLTAHGEGKHHIWMPIEIVRELSKNPNLAIFSKKVINELISQVNEERDLYKKFTFHAEIDFTDKSKLAFNGRILEIGYMYLINSTATQESVLLAENTLDAKAFLWGARTYLHIVKLGKLQVKLEISSGGGSTTYDLFKQLESGKKFFACILDSDKDHPKAKPGSTATRFRDEPLGYLRRRYLEILDCREIENIIPIAIIRELFYDCCQSSLIHDSKYIKYRAHPDHKEGIKLKDAIALDKKYRDNYWQEFSDMDEEATICAKFGPGLLKACVERMEKLSPKESIQYIDGSIDKRWIEICHIVASWGVGGRGLRS